MDAPPIASPTKPLRRLLKLARWFLFGLVTILTLIGLAYAIENLRGKYAWNSYRQQAERAGTKLDFHALVPPSVPDEQNGANIPLIHAWFDPRMRPKGDPTLWPDLFDRAGRFVSSDKDKSVRRQTDLVAWQEAFAAAEAAESKRNIRSTSRTAEEQAKAATNVLAALQPYDPALAQLREGMKRPRFRYPVDYSVENPFSILLPHLANIRSICSLLALHASANLAAGDGESALQDVLLSLHMVDSLDSESFLITYLVRVACLQTAAQPIWEGMRQHRWNEAQLKTLQERAAQFDFFQGMLRSLQTERAASIQTIDWIKRQKRTARLQALDPDASTQIGFGMAGISLMPRGWWDLEKVSYSRIFDAECAAVFEALKAGSMADAPHTLDSRSLLHDGSAAVWHHEVMARMLLPALDKVFIKAAMAQTLVNEIVTACALERARLAASGYPQTLSGLTPRFTAKPSLDAVTGQPLMYRVEGDGYVLYSIGWDRSDDGGVPGKVMFDDRQGDWVWRVTP